jgi:2'-hydroxyisoflavone reductase
MFRLLILGGTRFLGRHLAEAALERGHKVTLFNRGSNPGLFPQATEIAGDRDGGLDGLAGGRWDAVIDTCGYVPRIVRQSALSLEASVGSYCFVSSISAYVSAALPGLDESAPLASVDPAVETVTPESYGGLKSGCETAVEAVLPGRSLIIRPGMIVGPYDHTDRFGYWAWRLVRGGPALAAGAATAPIQLIDARDLAGWMLTMVEAGASGSYNATGPAAPLTMADMLAAGAAAIGSSARFSWIPDGWLEAQTEAVNLPFWIPASQSAYAGLFAVDCAKAQAAGLKYRPLKETFINTVAWLKTRPADHAWQAGISAEREATLLTAWNSQTIL